MSCEEDFYRQLRRRGFRLTPQREMVLTALHELNGLATADEILGRVQSVTSSAAVPGSCTGVDISTVYRTLDLLQEFRVVASVAALDGQRRYELLNNHGPHVHLVCRVCGRVLGADLEGFQSFMAYAKERYGFHIGVEQLSVTGTCGDCCASRAAGDIISK
jgi:Fur family transcriptional regulator, ferric uptake regulator